MEKPQQDNQQPETKSSSPIENMDFDSLPLEQRLSVVMSEIDSEILLFEKVINRLSKKQLERVLRKTIHYPLTQVRPVADEAERVVGMITTKIEHLKILAIRFAEELGQQQKEEENGSAG